MAHGVRAGWLRDASLEPCIFEGLLEDGFMEVVSALFPGHLVSIILRYLDLRPIIVHSVFGLVGGSNR